MAKRTNEEIELYQIKLYDYNCPSCTSGMTQVFTEDIEDFAVNYTRIEKDKERVDRLLRSKAGEMVTDYFSNAPSDNIVQKLQVKELARSRRSRKNQTVETYNGFNWPTELFFGMLQLDIRWIQLEDKFYKLVKPYGESCCRYGWGKSEWDEIRIYGNPFWNYETLPNTPHTSEEIEAFQNTRLKTFVWHIADKFDTEEELLKDLNRTWLLKEQMARIFFDIPGDAG